MIYRIKRRGSVQVEHNKTANFIINLDIDTGSAKVKQNWILKGAQTLNWSVNINWSTKYVWIGAQILIVAKTWTWAEII